MSGVQRGQNVKVEVKTLMPRSRPEPQGRTKSLRPRPREDVSE